MKKTAKPMPEKKRRIWERTIEGGKRLAEMGTPFWDMADAKANKFMLEMWGKDDFHNRSRLIR
jgi:hypothetical protein